MKNFIVDLGSFSVEAENLEQAQEKAIKMINSNEGWVEIDRIIEEDVE